LIGHALAQLDGYAVYATTKSDAVRTMLPEFGFRPLGISYRSELDEQAMLSLHVREPC
jgi:hypothetical protein